MTEYRWNISDFAVAYDQAAERIHPHYLELQEEILDRLPFPPDAKLLLVDVGGGSGRLVERFLERWPHASAVVVDQSEPFLALAERRLARFGERAKCLKARLQEDWPALLPESPAAVVSMSAIHHLDPAEKELFYARCFNALAAPGIFMNGDEIRPPGDAAYQTALQQWSDHMLRAMTAGAVPQQMHANMRGWIERNVTCFGHAKRSGDDCHETADKQLGYLRNAGFAQVGLPWCKQLWGLLVARKLPRAEGSGKEQLLAPTVKSLLS